MKSRFWILLLAALLVVCLTLSLWLLLSRQDAAAVRVISEGKVLYQLPLSVDTMVTVQTSRGRNVVTVKNGKVAVTEADCPDGYCMERGFCSGGSQIVCLPNHLIIRFVGAQAVDSVAG